MGRERCQFCVQCSLCLCSSNQEPGKAIVLLTMLIMSTHATAAPPNVIDAFAERDAQLAAMPEESLRVCELLDGIETQPILLTYSEVGCQQGADCGGGYRVVHRVDLWHEAGVQWVRVMPLGDMLRGEATWDDVTYQELPGALEDVLASVGGYEGNTLEVLMSSTPDPDPDGTPDDPEEEPEDTGIGEGTAEPCGPELPPLQPAPGGGGDGD